MCSTSDFYDGPEVAALYKMKSLEALKRNLANLDLEHIHLAGSKFQIRVDKKWFAEWRDGKRVKCTHPFCNPKATLVTSNRKIVT
tara:strand:- start:2552 stop:2806 length:255 start_codon:yes stop_codon:yes gene_type:complete